MVAQRKNENLVGTRNLAILSSKFNDKKMDLSFANCTLIISNLLKCGEVGLCMLGPLALNIQFSELWPQILTEVLCFLVTSVYFPLVYFVDMISKLLLRFQSYCYLL